MEFKDRLQTLRESKKMNIIQLADKFGKSEGAVRAWETGRAKPDVDTLIKLAKYFEVSTDFLLGLSDSKDGEKKGYPSALRDLMAKVERLAYPLFARLQEPSAPFYQNESIFVRVLEKTMEQNMIKCEAVMKNPSNFGRNNGREADVVLFALFFNVQL